MDDATVNPGYEVLIADAEALLRALPIESGRVRSHRLFKSAAVTVLGVAIDGGAVMHEHVVAVPILIQVVEGRVALELQQQRIELSAGAIVHVDGNVRHEVEGLEPTRFLLLLLGGSADASHPSGTE
ncbi:cupin domain-containing protein [Lysinimonas soli]|uniref:Cupin domain-containing protein n=1 Tax=Lysinimonas soli TaxID=1074233 RepID=A0ABW0NP03_9MICO